MEIFLFRLLLVSEHFVTNALGVRIPESVTKFNVKKASSNRKLRNDSGADEYDPVEMARDQFEIAANAGCDLGLKWLKLLDEEEKKKTGMSS